MSEKIKASRSLGMKTASFLRIANNLYRRYQDKLAEENLMDFDDLIGEAARLVHERRGELSIRVRDDQYVRLNDLRWIMIDEYQDFSNLFFDLIDAIRTYNKKARLFCVGDDWQAINAFAGSDLEYFEIFQEKLRNSNIGHLRNNYRSAGVIVDLGNKFMFDKGAPSIATRSDLKGKITVCRTDVEVWIECRSGEQHASERRKDERFRASTNLNDGKILKACNEILSNEKYDDETTFAILSRTDRLGKSFSDLAAFKRN